MTIHQIAFSPTGGTRRVGELLCSGIEAKSILTELCVKEEELCLPSIAAGDLWLSRCRYMPGACRHWLWKG